MKIAILSFTTKAKDLASKIVKLNKNGYTFESITNKEYNGGIKSFLKTNWNNYDAFIFISATGIAVRYIKDYIEDKTKDPAILVIDDLGRYVISLLSGHLGGANMLSEIISKEIKAESIVTTATDGRGIEAPDIFAKKHNYFIEDMKKLKDVTASMVEGKNVGFISEEAPVINYNNIKVFHNIDQVSDVEGLIIVSSKVIDIELSIPVAFLRPKNINIGIGCRKGVESDKIIGAIEACLKDLKLSSKSIRALGTVEIKKDEIGIIEAAKHYDVDMVIFTIDEISKVDHMFSKSDFVKKTIGVYSVSEPAAFLLGGKLILEKSKHDGITVSISKGGI